LTDTVNVGTNAGNDYVRPSTPPARSDIILVTSYDYKGDEVQRVTLTGPPTGGTFTLTFNGATTSAIAYNATAAAVQSALQALATIGSGNALVTGANGGPWAVRFVQGKGGSDQPEMTANGSGLIGGSVSVATNSQGGDAGRQQKITDPRGIVSSTDYDLLGRTPRTVEAFTDFVPPNSDDQTTHHSTDGT